MTNIPSAAHDCWWRENTFTGYQTERPQQYLQVRCRDAHSEEDGESFRTGLERFLQEARTL